MRIVSLSAPLGRFGYIQWFLILSIPLFAGVFVLKWIQGLKEEDIGLVIYPQKLHWEILVGFVGFPLGFIEYYKTSLDSK